MDDDSRVELLDEIDEQYDEIREDYQDSIKVNLMERLQHRIANCMC